MQIYFRMFFRNSKNLAISRKSFLREHKEINNSRKTQPLELNMGKFNSSCNTKKNSNPQNFYFKTNYKNRLDKPWQKLS